MARPGFVLAVGAADPASIPRLIWRHACDRKLRILGILGLALGLAGLALIPPIVVARLVDGAIEGATTRAAALAAIAGIAALAVADGLLTLLRRRLAVVNEITVRAGAARAHFRASLRLPLGDYAMGYDAALIRSFDDLDTVVEFVASRSVELFADAAIIIAYAGLMLAVDPLLALVFLGLAMLGLFVSAHLSHRARLACDAWLPVRDSRFAMIVECLTAMLTIKSLNAHHLVARPFDHEQTREEAGLRAWRLRMAMADAAARFFNVATPGIGAACGAVLLIDGRITAGSLLLFLAVSAGLSGALASLHGQLQEMAQAQASLARMRALRAGEPEALDDGLPNPGPSTLAAGGLVFRHQGAEKDTIEGVDLDLRPGQHIAITGRSGEGKTTLALLLARMFAPDRGEVTLEGAALAPGPHRQQVLLVANATTVFNTSVRENVRLWDSEIGDDAIWRALHQAQLRRLVEGWTGGLDAPLGAKGNPLSAGQQQRLGIARALLRLPAVLILDEATSAMDAQTEREVLASVRAHMRERSMIVITHREAVAAGFDRVLRMTDGRIVTPH